MLFQTYEHPIFIAEISQPAQAKSPNYLEATGIFSIK